MIMIRKKIAKKCDKTSAVNIFYGTFIMPIKQKIKLRQ